MHDLYAQAEYVLCPLLASTLVTGIHPQVREARKAISPTLEQQLDPVLIGNLRAVDLGLQDQSLRIHEQVTLSAANLLPTIVSPCFSAHPGSLCRLGIHYPGERYTAKEAAKILGPSNLRVKQLPKDEKLEGIQTPEGRWLVDVCSLNACREERGPFARLRRGPDESDLIDRLHTLTVEAGWPRGRLDLTEWAESTLKQEQNRLLEEQAERCRLQGRVESLSRPWW
jgi:hypothetical protein